MTVSIMVNMDVYHGENKGVPGVHHGIETKVDRGKQTMSIMGKVYMFGLDGCKLIRKSIELLKMLNLVSDSTPVLQHVSSAVQQIGFQRRYSSL